MERMEKSVLAYALSTANTSENVTMLAAFVKRVVFQDLCHHFATVITFRALSIFFLFLRQRSVFRVKD